MDFYIDFSFFVLLIPIVLGAFALVACGKSLGLYRIAVSILMLALMWLREPFQALLAALYVCIICCSVKLLLQNTKSTTLYRITLAAVLLPLVVCKISGAFGNNTLGFIGISYLMFRAVQILIECHDGIISEMPNQELLCFLIFFPTFTSGPIDRSRRFSQDLQHTPNRHEYADLLAHGILLFMLGLFYKVVLASIAKQFWVPVSWVDGGTTNMLRFLTQVKIAYSYGLYLFFDFAGYSSMALGISYALGIKTPRNFRAPFLATSITDFWNRWHISLSTWLRDFVYMRLVRSFMRHKVFSGKRARLRTSQLALIINMFIMGVWHGLTPSYLLYGIYHGILLAAEQSWHKTSFHKTHQAVLWYRIASWFVTMQLIFFGFALFSGQLGTLLG